MYFFLIIFTLSLLINLRNYLCVIELEKSQPKKKKIEVNNENNDDEYVWLDTNEPEKEITVNKGEPISVAKLYAKRENTIQSYKQRIGLLASTLLENPDLKVFFFCLHEPNNILKYILTINCKIKS